MAAALSQVQISTPERIPNSEAETDLPHATVRPAVLAVEMWPPCQLNERDRGVPGQYRDLAGYGEAPVQSAIISWDANSPIMMLGALVLAEGIVGMTEASAMRRPSTPRTRSSASTTASSPDPIAQLPTGCR